jgi:amidase
MTYFKILTQANRFTAGSYALLGSQVSDDATVVQLLRKAGAIVLGKTALSEWGDERSLNNSAGWSARGGQVYSSYYPEGNPKGSSSGSAVASS